MIHEGYYSEIERLDITNEKHQKWVGVDIVSDFKPISLLNGCYKIITKVVTNRLKNVLKEVINTNQAAFLRGDAF